MLRTHTHTHTERERKRERERESFGKKSPDIYIKKEAARLSRRSGRTLGYKEETPHLFFDRQCNYSLQVSSGSLKPSQLEL